MKLSEIKARAERVLDLLHINDVSDTYVDSVAMARTFGFCIHEDNLPAPESAHIVVNEDEGRKAIVVNKDRSKAVKRFAIAHELASYLLEYPGYGDYAHYEDQRSRHLESDDADYMAAFLLMPPISFSCRARAAEAMTYAHALEYLAEQFDVTTQLANLRLRLEHDLRHNAYPYIVGRRKPVDPDPSVMSKERLAEIKASAVQHMSK